MPGNSKRQMSVSIKVVNCREEVDKRYSILREVFQKNDCVYLTKMKGSDFTFKLTRDERQDLRSKNLTSSWGGSRYAPNVFTEQGVYMLMTILKWELAAKRFMQSFVDRIELYPERRKDGNWIKNILFNFSIPVVREDEELARIGGISLENSTLSNVELPLEKLSTHEMVVFLCERDQNLQFVNIKNPRIHGHYSPV